MRLKCYLSDSGHNIPGSGHQLYWGGGGAGGGQRTKFFCLLQVKFTFSIEKNFFSEYYHDKASSKASLKLYRAHVVYFILI